MAFVFTKLDIPEVILVDPQVFGDERGFFFEIYKKSDFVKNGIATDFVQENHSKSAQGVLRGLHYQLDPAAQGKLVRVVAGSIFDVAVDIREGSPTYGKWVSAELTAQNHHLLWIPEGFAHGFMALEEGTEMVYAITTSEYSKEHERGIIWNDPAIGITWPKIEPLLAEKDAKSPLLKAAEINFKFNKGEK